MGSVVTANRNVAIGSNTLRRSATATDNTCIGSDAGEGTATFTAMQNVFIGKDSGNDIETSTRNTCVGYQSGEFMTSSEGNIILGASISGHTLTTGGKNLLIGYDINLPSNTADNQMTIGNLLFSEGIDGTGTTLSTGHLGVGVVSPLAKLHVDQYVIDAAVPVLYLDQADISEEMIEFNTTIGTGNAIEAIGAKILTTTHFIKVTIPGGLTRYIPIGTIA